MANPGFHHTRKLSQPDSLSAPSALWNLSWSLLCFFAINSTLQAASQSVDIEFVSNFDAQPWEDGSAATKPAGYSTATPQAQTIQVASLSDLFELSLEELMTVKVAVASGFDESLLNAAASASKLSPADWQLQYPHRPLTALDSLPGISTTYWIGGAQQVFYRGFANGLSWRQSAILIDGIPLNDFTFGGYAHSTPNLFNLDLLERIELIRGPGSHLYGTSAMLGTTALDSWDSNQPVTDLYFRGGSFGYYQLALNNKRQIHDNLAWTLSINQDGKHDEHLDYRYTGEDLVNNGQSTLQARRYESNQLITKFSSDNFELGIYHTNFDNSDFPANNPFPGLANNGRNAGFDNSKFSAVKLNHNYDFNSNTSIASDLYTTKKEYHLRISSLDAPLTVNNSSAVFGEEQQIGFKTHLLFDETKTLPLRWRIGYEFDETEIKQGQSDIIGNARAAGYEGEKRRIHSIVYNSDYTLPNNKTIINLGGRYDDIDTVGDHFSPRAGIIHRASDTSSYKLLWSTAFRTPSAQELFDLPQFFIQGNPDLKEESITTYELIYVSQSDASDTPKRRFSIASYWNELDDPIFNVPGGSPTYQNLDSIKTQGIEIDYSQLVGRTRYSINGSHVYKNTASEVFPRNIINGKIEHNLVAHPITLAGGFRYTSRTADINETNLLYAQEELDHYRAINLHLSYTPPSDKFERQVFALDIHNLQNKNLVRGGSTRVENGILDSDRALIFSYKITVK